MGHGFELFQVWVCHFSPQGDNLEETHSSAAKVDVPTVRCNVGKYFPLSGDVSSLGLLFCCKAIIYLEETHSSAAKVNAPTVRCNVGKYFP